MVMVRGDFTEKMAKRNVNIVKASRSQFFGLFCYQRNYILLLPHYQQ